MAISLRGVSNAAGQASGSAAASTVSITPTLPSGAVAGDRIYVYQVGTTTSGTTPTNWTVVGTKDTTLGSGAAAAGTGLRRATWYYRDYDGVWTMPAFTLTSTANNSHWVGAVAITPSAGFGFDTPTTTTVGGAFNAATTSYTDSSAASFTTHSGGFLLVGTGLNDNAATSAGAVTQTGATFGTVTERCDGGTSTGFTVAGKIHTCSVTTGASATITHTETIASSQGETLFVEQTETALPKIATLVDDFASADSAKWDYTTAGVGVSVSAGQLHVNSSAQILSVNRYDPASSSVYFQIPTAGTFFYISVDSGSAAAIFAYNLFLATGELAFGSSSSPDTSVTYNATNHKWLRISESGGTYTFEASPDRSSWSSLGTAAISLPSAKISISGDGTVFDNVNTPGGTAWTATASLAVTATPSAAATRGHNAAASLAVTDTVTSAATNAATGNTSLAVTSAATAAVTRNHNAAASLAVTASSTGAVTNAGVVDSALPVTATTTGVVSRGQVLAAALSVTATGSADITRSHSAAASLAVTAGVTAAGLNSKIIDAALPVTATATAAGKSDAVAAASLAVTAAPTGTADKLVIAAASLAVTAAPTAAAQRTHNASAALAVTATPAGAATNAAAGTAALPVTAALTATVVRSGNGAASLAATVGLTATAATTRTAQAALAVNATPTASASVPVRTDDSRILRINTDTRTMYIADAERLCTVGPALRETYPDREPALIGPQPRLLSID